MLPTNDYYSCVVGEVIRAGRFLAYSPELLQTNGMWTWFTDPRAVYRNGATYFGWVTSAGAVGVSKYTHATGVVENFTLNASLETDDHNNAAVHFTPDGRVVCFYTKHPDGSGMRYRVSTIVEDISAFGAESTITGTALPITYSNPHYLSKSGKTYIHYRSGQPGGATNPMKVSSTSNFSSWDAERTWIVESVQRPYIKSTSNGYDRIDFSFTNCHPASATASIYHCYMQLDENNNELIYKSDGTLIGSSTTPANATLVYDGSVNEAWCHQIDYDSNGDPLMVFAKFVSPNNHRYMFAKSSGGVWSTPVEIAAAGGPMYASETYYSGGICFDGVDKNKVYLSVKTATGFDLQEYKTIDAGATWQKQKDITSGSTVFNCRPFSPKNHNGKIPVLWWAGSYSTYVSYNTNIMGLVQHD